MIKISDSTNMSPMLPVSFLDWRQRPGPVNDAVESAYQRICHNKKSEWGIYNGVPFAYRICGVNEHPLFKQIILEAKGERKKFYALDIGAGNFGWSQGLANYLNQQTDLPPDILVHIIGVRGEENLEDKIIETGRCKIYNLGAFKIEELFDRFKDEGFDLENKVDLAVSHWCIRHLADTAGTFAQLYNLLRPVSGTLLMDGFRVFCEGQAPEDPTYIYPMPGLLSDTGAPFLTKWHGIDRCLNHYMLQRPDAKPCQLPMSYSGRVQSLSSSCDVGAGCAVLFRRLIPDKSYSYESTRMYGNNQKMYDWLIKKDLLCSPSRWRPFKTPDYELPPLHQAIRSGELNPIRECLDRGDTIDECDNKGHTALCMAIRSQSYETFQLFLNRGALLNLSPHEEAILVGEAAQFDTSGQILQVMIDAGFQINRKHFMISSNCPTTPLSQAIWGKNLKAIELLIKAGSKISRRNYKEFKNLAFEPLHQKGIIPPKTKKISD